MKTVIYFDQDLLKIASSKASEGSFLSFLALQNIKNRSEKEIALEIRQALKKAKANRDHIVLDLPRHLVTLKNVELPTTKPDEIQAMMEFQVTRLIPYPKNEIAFDYQVLKVLPNQNSLVRVAIVPRKVLEKHLSILALADIYPSAIYLGTETLGSLLSNEKGATALLEIDYNQTHVLFLKDRKVQFSRNIPIGSRNLLEKSLLSQSALIEFLSELEASVAFFPVEQGRPFPFFIVGPTALLDLLKKPIEDRLKLDIQKLSLPIQVGTLVCDHLLDHVSLAGAICLLRNNNPREMFNLLPEDTRVHFENLASRSELKRMSYLLLTTLLLAFLTLAKEVSLQKGRLTSISQQIQTIEKTAGELETLKSKIHFLQSHMDHRGDCLRVISTLLGNIDDDIHIKILGYDSRKINLRGYAPSLSKVFEFVSLLEKNPIYQKIDTKYARQDTTTRMGLSEFHLEITLASLRPRKKLHA